MTASGGKGSLRPLAEMWVARRSQPCRDLGGKHCRQQNSKCKGPRWRDVLGMVEQGRWQPACWSEEREEEKDDRRCQIETEHERLVQSHRSG